MKEKTDKSLLFIKFMKAVFYTKLITKLLLISTVIMSILFAKKNYRYIYCCTDKKFFFIFYLVITVASLIFLVVLECFDDSSLKLEKSQHLSAVFCEMQGIAKVTEENKKELTESDKGVIKDCCCCCCDYGEKTETTNDKTTSTIIKKYNCNCPSKIRADMFKAYANAIVEI